MIEDPRGIGWHLYVDRGNSIDECNANLLTAKRWGRAVDEMLEVANSWQKTKLNPISATLSSCIELLEELIREKTTQ